MTFLSHYVEMAAMILFGIGFTTLMLHRNMMKKIIGFSMMDSAIFLYLAAKGYIEGRVAPFATVGEAATVEKFVNPIPTGLVLTGIVVSVSVSAFSFALAYRLQRRFGTLDVDEILFLAKGGAQ